MPPVITPPAAALRGKQIQHFTSDVAAVWTSTAGSLYTDGAATVPYAGGATASVYLKAKNVTGDYQVTATAGGATNAPISVVSVCPFNPSWKFKGGYESKFLEFIPDSGAGDRETREKRPSKYRCDFTASSRKAAEFAEFLVHHQAHYGTNKNFYFTHPGTNTEYLSYYDAPLEEEWDLNNLTGYSTVVREV